MEERRATMMQEYQRLQHERNTILQERNLLFERMEKIEQLQKLQRMYQEELRRLREQADASSRGEELEEHKTTEE